MDKKGIKINNSKTKVMVTSDSRKEIKIKIKDVRIWHVWDFHYLGVTMDERGLQGIKIKEIIEKTLCYMMLVLYYMMNNIFTSKRNILRETKIEVF